MEIIVSVLRGLLGVGVVVLIAWLLSRDRRAVSWRLVGGGLLLQLLIVCMIRYVPLVVDLFQVVGEGFLLLLDFTDEGVRFLLGEYYPTSVGASILVHSFPLIIFFSALVSVLYYWGLIQWLVRGLGWVLRRCMRGVSGVEGLVASGNVFLGMTESPLLIRPYLARMTTSEIFVVLVSGFGTISGSLIGVYLSIISQGNPTDSLALTQTLLSACLIAAPASIVISKIICPSAPSEIKEHCLLEQDEVKSKDLLCEASPKDGIAPDEDQCVEERASNLFDAIVSGTTVGLRLMVNVVAMLLVFVALLALINHLFGVVGDATGLNACAVEWSDGRASGFTLEFLLGLLLSPVAWLIGVPAADIQLVGSLMGLKIALNEFVGYLQLQSWMVEGVFSSPKSVYLSVYLLCGFANFSAIGIMLGGLTILAPERRAEITRYGLLAMFGGTLVSWLSAAMVGMLII